MKFLVCISKTPDTTAKIAFKDNNTKFSEENVQYIINPYDEWYALVRALEIKETQGGSVTVINVGKAENESIIRKAIAIGADEAVRIDAEPEDAFFVADQIAKFAKSENFDLILTGKETINYNGSVVGGMISELMDLPFVSLATKLDIRDQIATIEHDIDGGTETVTCPIPLVISAQKGMAEARIPNMRGIMAARTKPLKVIPVFEAQKLTAVKSYAPSAGRTNCRFIEPTNPEQLIELLHNEAKVI